MCRNKNIYCCLNLILQLSLDCNHVQPDPDTVMSKESGSVKKKNTATVLSTSAWARSKPGPVLCVSPNASLWTTDGGCAGSDVDWSDDSKTCCQVRETNMMAVSEETAMKFELSSQQIHKHTRSSLLARRLRPLHIMSYRFVFGSPSVTTVTFMRQMWQRCHLYPRRVKRLSSTVAFWQLGAARQI